MTPDGLGPRGGALWIALGQSSHDSPSAAVALEACRAADRLDLLDGMVRAGDLTVLQEARLQQSALKSLLESPVLKIEQSEETAEDEFTRARAARRAAATGL